MKMRWMLVLFAMALAAPLALAQGKQEKQEKQEKKGMAGAIERAKAAKAGEAPRDEDLVFTEKEVVVVKDWFRRNRRGLPPGLAKRDRLPPGLEMQLRTRGTLPPGLQKKVQPLPPRLERRLRPLPEGFRRVVLGRDVLLIEDSGNVIHDIIREALR